MTQPEVLEPEQVTFPSEGSRIHGKLYWEEKSFPRAVVLCHDAFGHQGYWEEYAWRLVENGFSVLTFDFAGHGESEGLRSQVEMPVWAYNVRDAMNFLGRQGFCQFALAGLGSGGSAALIASAHDQRVKCSIMFAAPVLMVPPLSDRILYSSASLVGPLVSKIRKRPFTLSRLAELDNQAVAVDELVCEKYRADSLVRQAYSSAPVPQSLHSVWLDITPSVKKVKQPVLVVHGQKDKIVPVKQSRILLENLASVKKLVLIEDAGHALHLDQASQEVFIQMVKWIKKYL